ncbi:E3 SUMO-protein ligase ZBED1-like [Pectinophora gossypiella]|uniref:E3 SUMO-protein ligase ZBED1-like n=1 Tax=Pectinophora gossypiella TaxID=13191 RepID=UPI00214E34F4|nr:E3 SUMO-protein ligase ZBED1-like [Pectinophora gossypiella]
MRLESVLLEAVVLQGHHDADNLASVIASILEDWQCRSKVVAMVTDNAQTMVKAAEILKLKHVPCFAHSLNLVIKHVLLEPECAALKELIDKCKAIVTYFKHSSLASNQLKCLQKDLKKSQLRPLQHVETRWNSAFQMLKRIGEIRDEVSLTLNKNPKAPNNLTDEEYTFLAEVIKVFEPIDVCTETVSGETYTTLSLIIPLIKGMLMHFAQLDKEPLLESTKTVLETIKKYIVTKVKPYETRTPCIVSTMLNPQLKKYGFKTSSEVERAVNIVQKEYSSYLSAQNKKASAPSDSAEPGSSNEAIAPPKKAKLNLLSYLQESRSSSSSATADAIVDINQYLSKPIIDKSECPIEYWHFNRSSLKNIASKYMCIPGTSTPAERIFSMAGQIAVERRNRLSGEHINEILFIKQNHTLLDK